jgi:uncharacterized protein YcnI
VLSTTRPRRRIVATLASLGVLALLVTASASAHARVSPPVSLAGAIQLFSLVVPTEEAAPVTTTKVVLTVPSGFSIGSFVPSPGWQRALQLTTSANGAVVEKVTWSGGAVPSGEDALFQFLGQPAAAGTYTFNVEQTYSNGAIVDWTGANDSATPAASIEARTSLGGSGTSLLTFVALGLALAGLVIAVIALFAGSGRRPLA